MNRDRRNLIKAASGASVILTGLTDGAKAAAPPSVAPLIAAGLDPLTVYRKMFASMDKETGTYWCFTGPLPLQIDEVGTAYFLQEETLRAQRTEDDGPDAFFIHWREAGVFRDMQTGNVPTSLYDPVTGDRAKHNSELHMDPCRFTVSRSREGLSIALEFPKSESVSLLSLTVAAAINGDRVSLTHTEYKLRPKRNSVQCAVLKIYSSLADLKGNAPFVPAQGFYSVRYMETGATFVSGTMQKAAMDERINPIAWDRVRSQHPEFFDGDRIAMNWS